MNTTDKKKLNIEMSRAVALRVAFLLVMDVCVIAVAKFMAVFIRFEFSFSQIPMHFFQAFQREIVPAIVLTVVVFAVFRLYTSLWEYAGVSECVNIFAAVFIAVALNIVMNKVCGIWMFRSYYVMSFMLMFFGAFGVRFFYRFLRWMKGQSDAGDGSGRAVRTMIVGAGDSGSMILRELRERRDSGRNVVCIVDDDPKKQGRYMRGVQICGGHEHIPELVEQFDVDEIILAVPSASEKVKSEIVSTAADTGCSIKMVPSVEKLLDSKDLLGQLRAVNVEDLLGREPIDINIEEIMSYVSGKVVLVTGGGGSIGSELCRQIVTHDPKKLIVVDIYENNAYDLQQELKMKHPDADVEFLIASVRDVERLRDIFDVYRPELVYHAAAHKHVPLMEDSPNEAIKNNVFGTLNTAVISAEYGVRRFVLISTDKAVNPTNIMGASKRICEMIIQSMNKPEFIASVKRSLPYLDETVSTNIPADLSADTADKAADADKKQSAARAAVNEKSHTEYVAVRFGNVLASNGSVVKLFEKQIAAGGPVTVTHPDIVRYFMTIPEAVALVLQAGAYANGGEIFVFDMGAPVKIDDLARRMIRMAGCEPDVDIKIKYTGLRPGEKLYEELLMAEEGMKDTPNKLIHIGRPIELDTGLLAEQLGELHYACEANSSRIAELVAAVVPTYKLQK